MHLVTGSHQRSKRVRLIFILALLVCGVALVAIWSIQRNAYISESQINNSSDKKLSVADVKAWTQYTDPKGSYTFRYPQGWNVSVSSDGGVNIFAGQNSSSNKEEAYTQRRVQIYVNVVDLPTNWDLAQYLQNRSGLTSSDDNIASVFQRTVAGMPAFEIKGRIDAFDRVIEIIFIRNRKGYAIGMAPYETSKPQGEIKANEVEQIFDTVVSSFRFLN